MQKTRGYAESTMKTSRVLLGLALLVGAYPASATVKTVALTGDQTPQFGYFFRKFGLPVVSDVAGAHVAVFNKSPGGLRCIFKLDPDSTSDATVACEKDAAPNNALFQRLGDYT